MSNIQGSNRRAALLLTGARSALDASRTTKSAIALRRNKIQLAAEAFEAHDGMHGDEFVLDMTDYMLLPGLINAHDHLDFSIFPRMGRSIYPNWQEWAKDIYHPNETPLRDLLSVPKPVRLRLGGLRNLLCGVTTVAHHNPYLTEVFERNFPVDVLSRYRWAHSLEDPRAAQEAYQETPSDWPFFLHFAEGTDADTYKEFHRLCRNLSLDNRLVLIHAVGVSRPDLHSLANAGVSLVWCPSSNMFTLGQTLSAETVCSYPFLVLGSDSPLTAVGDLLDEVRYASSTMQIPAELLYQMVTTRAAAVLRLPTGSGTICSGAAANLIAVRDQKKSPADTLASSSFEDIECVIREGRIMLLSSRLANRVPPDLRSHLEEIRIGPVCRYLPSSLASLIRKLHSFMPEFCALRGERLTA
jgi:cytosine/adenosine deaminase-related metal-dependent hydrolase